MDALLLKFLRDMSLGLLYILMAACLAVLFPVIWGYRALRDKLPF